MNHAEYDAFLTVIARVVARTNALVFSRVDSAGALEYNLFPRRRMPLEDATRPRRPIPRKRPRGAA